MCWEDLVMARRIKGDVHRTNTTLTIRGNGKRIGFRIGADQGQGVDLYLKFDGNLVLVAHAVNAHTGSAENTDTNCDGVTIHQIGDLIYGEFVLLAPNGGFVTAIETWLDDPPDVARKAMENR